MSVEGDLTVAAGHKLTLFDADIIAGGSLTATAGASNDATISFEDALGSLPTFDVAGTLTLTGTSTSERNAKVLGDADSRINVEVTGTFSGTDFTFEYPDGDGLHVNSTTQPTIIRGTFDNPVAGIANCLLNLSNASSLPTTIAGCIFNNTVTGDVAELTGSRNVRANNITAIVTFIDFSGTLAPDATNAELYDKDDNSKVTWFNNVWYSSGNRSPHLLTSWFSKNDGSGVNPSDFTNSSHQFVIQNFHTYASPSASWSPAGKIKVENGGTIGPGDQIVTIGGETLIESGGTLDFTDAAGIFDTDGTFSANGGGIITFTAAGTLKLAAVTPDLGSNLTGSGTIEYDLAGDQNIFNTTYNNLEIDGSGLKKVAHSPLDVDGNLTITNGTLDMTNVGTQNNVIDLEGNFLMNGGVLTAGTSDNHDVVGDWNDVNGTFQSGASAAGTITLSGVGSNINTAASNNFFNLTINSAGTETAQTALDVDGAFTISGGTFANGSLIHNVAGDWNDVNGTYQAGAAGEGTITLSGASSNINTAASNNFFNLTINSAGTETAQTALDVDGAFTISGGTFANGSLIHNVAGDWNDVNGTYQAGAAGEGTITLSGASSNINTAASNNFFNLTINSAGTETAQTALDVDGELEVTTGTLAMAGNNANVAGITDIDGTLSITTGIFTSASSGSSEITGTLTIGAGTYNADGEFTATW